MASQFRRSRQKLSNPFSDCNIDKENISTNINHHTTDILQLRRHHHQQIKSKQIHYQRSISNLNAEHRQAIQSIQSSYQHKLRDKQDIIRLLEETIRNLEVSSQAQIESLKRKLQSKEKQLSAQCITSCSARESFITPNLSQRISVSRDRSRSILGLKESIQSKHKGIPARKPVYTKQFFLQRKGINLLRLQLD